MRSLLSLSCAALALLTFPAMAATADSTQAARQLADKTIQLQDRDHDGRISLKESAGAAMALFGTIDADGSQLISSHEMLDTVMNDAAALKVSNRADQTATMVASRFQAMDIDGDGSISLPEMMAITETVFDAADGNGDGYVSENELIDLASSHEQAIQGR